jgi:hypothetical protein
LRKKEERRAYIAEKMRSLPGPTLSFITYLARVERTRYNRAGRCPVWDEHLFPSTKKRVHEYERYDRSRWLRFFRGYMAKLEARYRSHGPAESDRLLAYFTLQYHPQEGSGEAPDPRLIRRNYRRLSKLYHPDAGGDPEHFVELKRAFDSLLTRGEQEQK